MSITKRKYGWRPDVPDVRDHRFSVIRKMFLSSLPSKVDLRAGCPPVEDQGQLGSCTAQAIVGCLEFLETKFTNRYTDLSRLFLYYQERRMIGTVNEDSGACLRDGIKVLSKIGTPHENSWPYHPTKFAVPPPKEVYPEAKTHCIKDYQRLGSINEMRACLAMGYPFVFGFAVYESFEGEQVARTGVVSLPSGNERMLGGHAVMAVGYDHPSKTFIVRNSWGANWGQKGYFTMPYDFLSNPNLSEDFWTIRR